MSILPISQKRGSKPLKTFLILLLLISLKGEREGLSPHQPAIDRDHRASHIVREDGRKELDHFRAILDGPEPP